MSDAVLQKGFLLFEAKSGSICERVRFFTTHDDVERAAEELVSNNTADPFTKTSAYIVEATEFLNQKIQN